MGTLELMTMRITLFIILTLLGCSASKIEQVKVKEPEKETIVGKWKFEWNKPIGDFSPEKFELKNDSTFNLLQFFGAEIIKESTGKWIEFTDNNKILTNLLEQIKIDELKFGYQMNVNDSMLIFSAVSPKDNKKFTIPTKIVYQDSVMFWNIDDLIAIKLKRIK